MAFAMLTVTQTGCAGHTDEDGSSEDQATLAIDGNFKTTAAAAARFRAGYLYEIDISKPLRGNRSVTLYLVSDECSKQSADKTCDRAFIDKNAKSLLRVYSDLSVRSGVLKTTYQLPDGPENSKEVTSSWSYEKTATGLKLTPTGSKTSFTVDSFKTPATPVDPKLKALLLEWSHTDDSYDDVNDTPAIAISSAPVGAQREYYLYANSDPWGYAALNLLTYKGTKFYVVNEVVEGNGGFEIFSSKGAYLGSYHGTESSDWYFTAADGDE